MKSLVKLLLVCAVCCAAAYGQAVSQIGGAVRDESGAVVPLVQVTATQTETGFRRTAETDESGNYVLLNLPLGPYRLEAMKMGFRSYVQTGISLQVGTSPEIPITLGVGQVSETVNVEANASQIETRSIGVGTVIETQRILELPLNGRQPTDLITLNGAAVQTGASPGYGMRTGVFISVAGSGIESVQYNLDGAPNINMLDGTGLPLPFPDALQEFKLSTSTQDAANSGHSGAAVHAVTKSGTNSFHGDAFEFLRNYNVNARSFFARGLDGLKRNQFGGVIGGPIKKDKIFFFLGYQGTTVRQTPINQTGFVPTPQMIAGDFTTFASAACQNGVPRTLGAPFGTNGFAPNTTSPASLSPAAINIARRLPTTTDGCGRTLFGAANSENGHQAPVRVDYQLSDKQTLFARYLITQQDLKVPYNLSNNALEANVPGFNDRSQSFSVGDTYVLNATMVNSFRASVNRVAALKPGADFFGAGDVGINMFTYQPKYLQMVVTGNFTLGGTTKNAFAYQTSFGANDDFSIVKGAHTIVFGGYYTRAANWLLAQAFADGQFQFGTTSGTTMSDFMLGRVLSLRQANPNPLNTRQNFFALYLQDTWKINQRLTLNYGINWAPYFPGVFPHADTFNFGIGRFIAGSRSTVIPNAPPGFTYPGDPGFNGKSGIESRWGNINPRIGIAWDPMGDGKTVIRVGGSMAQDFMTANMMINNETASPFRLTVIQSGVNLDNPYANYPGGRTPFPYNYDSKNPVFAPFGTYLPVPPNLRNTMQYSWNLGVQRQITPNWFAAATYMGTHIIHLWNAVELNPGVYIPGSCVAGQYGLTAPGLCTQASTLNARRALNLSTPGTQLGNVTQYDDGGTQGYHGLLLSTSWRMKSNLSVNANYTWSHCIGLPLITLLNPGANYIHQGYGQNIGTANRNLDVGNCLQDRRQVANITLVASTPKFSNKIARMAGSGWTFSSAVVARTGPYLTIVTGATDNATGFGGNSPGTQRVNQVLAEPASASRGSSCGSAGSFCVQWLNPAAFQAPALGTFGNMGQSAILGPGFWQWDGSLSRQFAFTEAQKLEIRFEGFNITNSFRPGSPGLATGAANTFGVIQSDATPAAATTAPARVMQFALKFVF
ncbi:MAG: carboxypeptidase-like regulatory domain-containing protein [Bryobacteraceae bacterium]